MRVLGGIITIAGILLMILNYRALMRIKQDEKTLHESIRDSSPDHPKK